MKAGKEGLPRPGTDHRLYPEGTFSDPEEGGATTQPMNDKKSSDDYDSEDAIYARLETYEDAESKNIWLKHREVHALIGREIRMAKDLGYIKRATGGLRGWVERRQLRKHTYYYGCLSCFDNLPHMDTVEHWTRGLNVLPDSITDFSSPQHFIQCLKAFNNRGKNVVPRPKRETREQRALALARHYQAHADMMTDIARAAIKKISDQEEAANLQQRLDAALAAANPNPPQFPVQATPTATVMPTLLNDENAKPKLTEEVIAAQFQKLADEIREFGPASAPAPESEAPAELENHAQTDVLAALARTQKVSGPYHLSAERTRDVIYRENQEPEAVTWFVEHFASYDEAVTFAASVSHHIPVFDKSELFSRGHQRWDWFDDDAEISWSIQFGHPVTAVVPERIPEAPPEPDEMYNTENAQLDELLMRIDEMRRESEARHEAAEAKNRRLEEEENERRRIDAERLVERKREIEERMILEAAVNTAANNYQKAKARRIMRAFDAECQKTHEIYIRRMDRLAARSIMPPPKVRKYLSILGLTSLPTLLKLNTVYRQQAAALYAKFGSNDTAPGYNEEFILVTEARDALLELLKG